MKPFLYLLFIALFSCCASKSIKNNHNTSPNIVIIMADDMGFSDLGCYGGEIPTPHIDALATSGIKCSQFYNAGRCCPSRASLMTGKYAHNVNMGWMTAVDMERKGYHGNLSKEFPTIAENLLGKGYATYMVGKWHLMSTDSVTKGIGSNWPTDRGFDKFYGTLEGAKDYYIPENLYSNRKKIQAPKSYFYTHAIIDTAVSYIRENKKNPFFLYTAFYAPHFPLHAPKEIIEKYIGTYKNGWQVLRKQRLQKQKDLGLLNYDFNISKPGNEIPDWNTLDSNKQLEMDLRMAIYAAQIEELDKGVGKIVDELKSQGIYENTIIVFLSDNGAEGSSVLGMGSATDLNKSGPYTSYGRSWANASNTPYRKYKSFAHEGGIIAPLIISWPEKLKPRTNFLKQPIHIIDLMETIGSLSNNKFGKTDGMDMSAWFLNDELPIKERHLFWEHEGKRAVRIGDWKLVAAGLDLPWELYHLKNDPIEENNLINKFPERKTTLELEWLAWAKNSNVLPLDGRNWSERVSN